MQKPFFFLQKNAKDDVRPTVFRPIAASGMGFTVVGSNARALERWTDTLNVGLRFCRTGAHVTRGGVPQLPPAAAQQRIPWEYSSDRLQDTALRLEQVNF